MMHSTRPSGQFPFPRIRSNALPFSDKQEPPAAPGLIIFVWFPFPENDFSADGIVPDAHDFCGMRK